MPLHLLKLCVGIESIEHLARVQKARRKGRAKGSFHITRQLPKRAEEILDGGSIYWVIKGVIRVRQRIIGIDTIYRGEGRYCRLLLHRDLVPVVPQPRRPHQGWRYLDPADAPADLTAAERRLKAMPPEMLAELKSLGLL